MAVTMAAAVAMAAIVIVALQSVDGIAYVLKLVALSEEHPLQVAASEAKIHSMLQHSAIVRYVYSWAEEGGVQWCAVVCSGVQCCVVLCSADGADGAGAV